MQVILGSGGAIGNELAKALPQYTSSIRLVSRNPKAVNASDSIFPADVLNRESLNEAVKDAEIVYSTVGFPYSIKTWEACWPLYTQNLIDACAASNSKLVFFDNIYMYNPEFLGHMTEETPFGPVSKKGRIRQQIIERIQDAVEQGKIDAQIARSADFYGPGIKNTSVLTQIVFERLHQGKKAQWLASDKFKHSFTYTPDAGKAVALLGNTSDAYNQTWHIPTADNPPTGNEWVNQIAAEMNKKPGVQLASNGIVRLLGLFMPIMREMHEMLYQYDRDYVFSSSKFEKRFGYSPTPYAHGIKEIVQKDYMKE